MWILSKMHTWHDNNIQSDKIRTWSKTKCKMAVMHTRKKSWKLVTYKNCAFFKILIKKLKWSIKLTLDIKRFIPQLCNIWHSLIPLKKTYHLIFIIKFSQVDSCSFSTNLWTQDLSWTYMRRTKVVLKLFWVLCTLRLCPVSRGDCKMCSKM